MQGGARFSRRAVLALPAMAALGGKAWANDEAGSKLIDAVRPNSNVSVLYVGAWDCGFCQSWKVNELPKFRASRLAGTVTYREVETPRFRQLDYMPAWPEDLKWFQAKLNIRSGTPRFYVLVSNSDNKWLWFSAFGSDRWSARIVPLLEKIAKKRGLA